MKLSTKGRYAVMAMADLALFKDKGPINLTEISLRQNISLAYLEQIFIKLKKNNLVKSVRGAKGGYELELTPEEIKISNMDNQTCLHGTSSSWVIAYQSNFELIKINDKC